MVFDSGSCKHGFSYYFSVSFSVFPTRKQVSSFGSFLKFRIVPGAVARIHKFDSSLRADLLETALSSGFHVFPSLGRGSVELVLPSFRADLVSAPDIVSSDSGESLLLVFGRPKSWVQSLPHRGVAIAGTAFPKKEACRGSKVGYTDSPGAKNTDTAAVSCSANAVAISFGVVEYPSVVTDCIAGISLPSDPHAPTIPTPTSKLMPTPFMLAPASLIRSEKVNRNRTALGGVGKEIPLVLDPDRASEVAKATTADANSSVDADLQPFMLPSSDLLRSDDGERPKSSISGRLNRGFTGPDLMGSDSRAPVANVNLSWGPHGGGKVLPMGELSVKLISGRWGTDFSRASISSGVTGVLLTQVSLFGDWAPDPDQWGSESRYPDPSVKMSLGPQRGYSRSKISDSAFSGWVPVTFSSCSSLFRLNLGTNRLSMDFLARNNYTRLQELDLKSI